MKNKIYLRYGNYASGSISWQTGKEYAPLILRKLFITERISGTDLRSINFSHLKSKRTKSYEITISANDLVDSAKLTYLENILTADCVQYSFDNADWSNAVDITFEYDGAVPFEMIENHKKLLKLKFQLIQKYPD